MGRFVRIRDQSGRSSGNVVYARGFGSSERSKLLMAPPGHDNDELVLADLIDETPAIVPVVLPVGWFQSAPKLRAIEADTLADPWGVALIAERFPSHAGQDEGDFILPRALPS
jgi:hypothetical protein